MTWTKLSDDALDRPDLLALPRGVRLLHLEATVWCNRHGTDGHVPRHVLPRITDEPDPERAAAQLVAADRWATTETGWQIVDFLVDQLSAADTERTRERARERQRRQRQHRQGDHSLCDPRYCHAVTRDTTRDSSRDDGRDAARDIAGSGAATTSTVDNNGRTAATNGSRVTRDSRKLSRVSHKTPSRPDPSRPDPSRTGEGSVTGRDPGPDGPAADASDRRPGSNGKAAARALPYRRVADGEYDLHLDFGAHGADLGGDAP